MHDGAVAESFNQMRHLLDLMLQHTETAIKMRRISSGVNVPMSLDELIRNYRSERNKQNATLKAITFFLEQAASRRLRKLRPESGKNEIYLYEPLVIDGYTTVSFSRVGTLDAWSVAAGGGGGGGWKTNHHAGLPISCAPTAIPTSSTPSAQRRRRCPRPASELWFERLTFNSSYRKATRYLESTEDSRFPFYEVSEFVHGFENCYVDTMECRAYFYADNPQGTSRLVSRHHHAGVRLEKSWFSLRERRRACITDAAARTWTFPRKKHLDGTTQDLVYPFPKGCVDGGAEPPPLHLQMPAMQQLLDFQDFTPEMQSIFFCMWGRTLLPVGTRDQFACIMLMSGETQSGKSTALEAFSEALLPNTDRIAILSSNKEDKFGLQTSFNKVSFDNGKAAEATLTRCATRQDVLICDEMERKPSWNLGEIKSMATGGQCLT